MRQDDGVDLGGRIGSSCQLRSRSSFSPWNSPASISTFDDPVSSRYFDPVTVRAAPRNVDAMARHSREKSDLAAGVPEEHRAPGPSALAAPTRRSSPPSPWPCRSDRGRAPRSAPPARWPPATQVWACRSRRRRIDRRPRSRASAKRSGGEPEQRAEAGQESADVALERRRTVRRR